MQLGLRLASSILAIGIAACGGPSPEPPTVGEPVPDPSTGPGGGDLPLNCHASPGVGGLCTTVGFCQDPNGTCAMNGAVAYCVPLPSICPGAGPAPTQVSVCGCDGRIYTGVCDAAQNASDVNADASQCASSFGPNMFACGTVICDASAEYCRRSKAAVAGGADAYACAEIPASCVPGECSCLGEDPCADTCTAASIPTGSLKALSVVCP